MAFFDNTSELELPLLTPQQRRQQESIHQEINQKLSTLPVNKAKYDSWLKTQRAKAVSWRTISPIKTKASIGWLQLQKDQSIFASGDTRKHDIYDLEFTELPEGITCLLYTSPSPRDYAASRMPSSA